MLARLSLKVPFNFAVAKNAKFTIYEYESDGYKIRVWPPSYTGERAAFDPDTISINGEDAVLANIVRIDFQKATYDRTHGAPLDPPEEVIQKTVRSFITRFRHVSRGFIVSLPNFPQCVWRMEYCDDDGVQVPPTEGFFRARGAQTLFESAFTRLTPEMWTAIHDLEPTYEPQPWEVLLLDAQAELPKIGTSIVLAATALELFIAHILDELAKEQPPLAGLWAWVNNRDENRQAPTVEKQYDSLLKLLCGHSLKEEAGLWENFQNLKQARNTFVHEGAARVGKAPVDTPRADQLIRSATQIILKIREWLPQHLRWSTLEQKVEIVITKAIALPATANAVGVVPSDETNKQKK